MEGSHECNEQCCIYALVRVWLCLDFSWRLETRLEVHAQRKRKWPRNKNGQCRIGELVFCFSGATPHGKQPAKKSPMPPELVNALVPTTRTLMMI